MVHQKGNTYGTCLAVQLLRLSASTVAAGLGVGGGVGRVGSAPGWGTKIPTCHAVQAPLQKVEQIVKEAKPNYFTPHFLNCVLNTQSCS